jgi:hypothetical protein
MRDRSLAWPRLSCPTSVARVRCSAPCPSIVGSCLSASRAVIVTSPFSSYWPENVGRLPIGSLPSALEREMQGPLRQPSFRWYPQRGTVHRDVSDENAPICDPAQTALDRATPPLPSGMAADTDCSLHDRPPLNEEVVVSVSRRCHSEEVLRHSLTLRFNLVGTCSARALSAHSIPSPPEQALF